MAAPVGAGIRDRLPEEVIRSPPEALGEAGLGARKVEGMQLKNKQKNYA